jgi:hypothetical protein
MEIILFILIAGAWAAFLLPSFFDHRRENPKATTRAFARSKAMLANVTVSQVGTPAYARHHARMRRKRILLAMAAAAFLTLTIAVLWSSTLFLGLTIVVDLMIGGYVAMLLAAKQPNRVRRAPVVRIPTSVPASPTTAADLDFEEASPTVRVIAG